MDEADIVIEFARRHTNCDIIMAEQARLIERMTTQLRQTEKRVKEQITTRLTAEITARLTAEITARLTAEITARLTAEITAPLTAKITAPLTAKITEQPKITLETVKNHPGCIKQIEIFKRRGLAQPPKFSDSSRGLISSMIFQQQDKKQNLEEIIQRKMEQELEQINSKKG